MDFWIKTVVFGLLFLPGYLLEEPKTVVSHFKNTPKSDLKNFGINAVVKESDQRLNTNHRMDSNRSTAKDKRRNQKLHQNTQPHQKSIKNKYNGFRHKDRKLATVNENDNIYRTFEDIHEHVDEHAEPSEENEQYDLSEHNVTKEKKEKIRYKHHHHHHHHNHIKEIIKRVKVPVKVEKIVRVPVEVEKIVKVPVEVEKIIRVPVEKIVKVPVKQIVKIPVDRLVEVEKIIEKIVPIEKIVEKVVHIPRPYPVHVPKPYPLITKMPVEIKIPVEKPIPVPFPVKVPVYIQPKDRYEELSESKHMNIIKESFFSDPNEKYSHKYLHFKEKTFPNIPNHNTGIPNFNYSSPYPFEHNIYNASSMEQNTSESEIALIKSAITEPALSSLPHHNGTLPDLITQAATNYVQGVPIALPLEFINIQPMPFQHNLNLPPHVIPYNV